MILDTHLHISEYSPDSFMPVRDAVARAKAMGLDGLCITDHDTLGVMAEIDSLRRECHFPLFVGVEILTTGGDFVVFGLDQVPERMLTPQELMELVDSKDAVATAAHPFRDNGRGAGDLIRQLPTLAGVECFNGSTKPEANLQALKMARELGKSTLGASDAHWDNRIGLFVTSFPGFLRDERDLIGAIRKGGCSPLAWDGQRFVDAESWCLRQLEERPE